MIWTARAPSHGWQGPKGGRYFNYRPPPARHLIYRPALAVATTPPQLRAVPSSPSSTGRRRPPAQGTPWRRRGREHRRAGLPLWEDFPCSVSLRADRERREPPGAVVTGHQLPARRAQHDVVDHADLVFPGRAPLSTGGPGRGGLARARDPRGARRHPPRGHRRVVDVPVLLRRAACTGHADARHAIVSARSLNR